MRASSVRRLAVLALSLGAALASGPAWASSTACPGHFPGGNAPDILNPKLTDRAEALCYEGFAVLHSGLTRTPLWSAEHLTRSAVQAARQLPREGTFHSEPALPRDEAANLRDYRGTGYDRGHMSPNGDMGTPEAQQQSFSLANMIPQAPKLNRVLWEGIESAVRNWAIRAGDVYVVTGPVFQGASLQMIGGRVLVPTLVFKAVYDPGWNQAGVYLCRNSDDSSYETISVDQLTAMIGIDVFPGVPAVVKMRVITLPSPTPHYAGEHGRPDEPPSLGGMVRSLLGDMQR